MKSLTFRRLSAFIRILSLAAIASPVFAVGPASANYSGTWLLDLSQSKNLPSFYSGIKSHALTVKQGANSLDVGVTVQPKEGSPVNMSFPYKLDGTETTTEAIVRTPDGDRKVPTKLKAELAADGSIHITISREMGMTAVTVEDWKLSSDGTKLIIHRVDDGPRGRIDTEMVFVKG